MKAIQIIIIILIIGLISFMGINGCSYLSLKVSDKYETQLEGITKSPEALQKAKEKTVEIAKEKRRIGIESAISLFVILLLLFIYYKLYNKHQ